MIQISNVEILGWEHAIRGMRNPKNSWDKSDSAYGTKYGASPSEISDYIYYLGDADLKLMTNLAKAGTDHAKYRRMITVYADIVAPLYWWKEYDTYKVGTVANSCSTMHKIQAKEFELSDFSCEHLSEEYRHSLERTIDYLNHAREDFIETKDKAYWWDMIQLLPTSYNQRRTVQLNYEVLANMYKSRKFHKLDEWREFCTWVESLPYSELITNKES